MNNHTTEMDTIATPAFNRRQAQLLLRQAGHTQDPLAQIACAFRAVAHLLLVDTADTEDIIRLTQTGAR